MAYIRVPSLAENVDVATVAKWLVAEGDDVSTGDGVAEMLTEKADFVLEAAENGVVSRIFFPEKSVVPVGAVLLALDCNDDEIRKAELENEQRMNVHGSHSDAEKDAPSRENVSVQGASVKVRATPAARRLAREHGVDLEALAARVGGLVREEHVRAETG